MKKIARIFVVAALLTTGAAFAMDNHSQGSSASATQAAGMAVNKGVSLGESASISASRGGSISASSGGHSSQTEMSASESRTSDRNVVRSTMTRCAKSVSGNVEETVCQTKRISAREAEQFFKAAEAHSRAEAMAQSSSSMLGMKKGS